MTDEEKEKIRSLMQRLAVVNRVMSSDSVVKVLEFRSYCFKTYEQILNDFPFASVSETVHRLLSHTWEFVVLNGNCGLLRQGEGGSDHVVGPCGAPKQAIWLAQSFTGQGKRRHFQARYFVYKIFGNKVNGNNFFTLSGRLLHSLTRVCVALTAGPTAVCASATLTLPGDVLSGLLVQP